jgi:uncharacterized protein (TIGR04255 family)
METQKHLTKAPITEAIIDFRVKNPPAFQAQQFEGLKERLGDRYPTMEKSQLFKERIQLRGDGSSPSVVREDLGLQGYVFKTANGLEIAQFRIDGFTFSRLRLYSCWEDVFSEAFHLWNVYVGTSFPEVVTRIAVRYINHMRFPSPASSLAEYLSQPPPVPSGAPRALESFLTRVVVNDPQRKLKANIIQTMEKSLKAEEVTIILDIDVYKKSDYEPADGSIPSAFQEMRRLKNDIFFNSVTPGAVRLFE